MGYNMFLSKYESSGNTGFSYLNDDLKNTTVAKGLQGLTPLIGMKVSDEDESTTKSAIADGTIVLTKPSEQKQDVTQLNRNTQDTLNKLDKIFDKKEIEEKQELAGLFAELSFNAIHELSTKKEGNEVVSKWTPTQRAMAHAAVGFITASLADSKTPISTALANGVNVYVVSEINKNKELREYFNEHPDELQWISAGIGAGIGGLTGSNISDISSGASAAAKATKENYGGRYLVDEIEKNKVVHEDGSITSSFVDPATGKQFTTTFVDNETYNYFKLSLSGGNGGVSAGVSAIFDPYSGFYVSADGSIGLSNPVAGGKFVVGSVNDKKEGIVSNSELRRKYLSKWSYGYEGYFGTGGGVFTPSGNNNISLVEVGIGTPTIDYSTSHTWLIMKFDLKEKRKK